MKAVLHFKLPEDEYEHTCAIKGKEYRLILYDITSTFRDKHKYSETTETTWENVYGMLWDIFKEYNFDPWEE